MATPFERINYPELFFGFVAPIGVDLTSCIRIFKDIFEGFGYNVIELKVTDVFRPLAASLVPKVKLVTHPRYERFVSYIAYGNQIREFFEDDQILAATTCVKIMRERLRSPMEEGQVPQRNAYLLHQFKRREEIELLRSVYGRLFFQVSVYSRRGARVDFLARDFARAENVANPNAFRDKAEHIVQIDENETGANHGQRVSAIFHDADVIINADTSENSISEQIARFSNLLFGSNKLSPTKMEYGMFVAKAAALRTLDLSRQVGAAIFTAQGEVLSMGSNEVPKALGGTYWCDTENGIDDRDYVRDQDSNDRRKRQLLTEIFTIAGIERANDLLNKKEIKDSQFMDALEYGRIIHAEMSVICDAARLGVGIRDAILFCTTFPCHMCAKLIVASGIKRVVFLEPYPKSLTAELHGDSVMVEGSDRGRYQQYPYVEFVHFYGICPRRYREIFERQKRKDELGNFVEWADQIRRPIIDIKFPFYMELEKPVLNVMATYLERIKLSIESITATQEAAE